MGESVICDKGGGDMTNCETWPSRFGFGWWKEFVQAVCKAKAKARRMDEQAWMERKLFYGG